MSAQFDHHDKSHFILFIKDSILRLIKDRGVEIKLIWISSHIEISGNEQADGLAGRLLSLIGIRNWESQLLNSQIGADRCIVNCLGG